MKTFTIQQNTAGILIIQEKDMDATTENFSVRKDLSYTEENILVDPAKFEKLGKLAYEADSMAARFAAGGYFVFSDVKNDASRYMIAVHANQVRILN